MSQRRKTAGIFTAVSAIVSLVLLAAPGRPAMAQAGPNPGAAGTNASPGAAGANQAAGGKLQEIVVTAERRATNIQTTPISVVAISGAQLSNQNIVQIQSLQLSTPSLTFNNDGLYQSPQLRGIGTAFSPSLPLGVALTEDGLFIAEQHGFGDPFYDIADVEVLRGPQGTFIGYNSTGGAIEITSANPNFRGTNGYAELQAGNYTDKRVDGAVNFVLDPNTLAVRLAFNMEKRNSFYRDIGSLVIPGHAMPIQDPGRLNNEDLRLSTLWKPSDRFQALLKLQWSSQENGGDPAEINPIPFKVPAGEACPDGSAGPVCHSNYYTNTVNLPFVLDWTPQNGVLPALGHPYYNYRNGLRLDYTLADGLDLRSLTGFEQTQYNTLNNNCNCNIPTPGGAYQWIPKDNYYSEEVDLISPTTGSFFSKLNFIAGASWFYRDTGVTVLVNNSAPPYDTAYPLVVKLNVDTVARIMGVFGQLSWQFAPTLQLQVGARGNWDNTVQRGTIDQVQIPYTVLPPFLGLTATSPPRGCIESPAPNGYLCSTPNMYAPFTDSVPTGKIDLNWTPLKGQFFYAFYARGYKGGVGVPEGTITAPAAPNIIGPEHVNDYEIGWNGTMLDGRMRTHLGGYWMVDQGSQQAGIFNPLTGSTNSLANLGSATLKGIEASLDGRFGGLGVNFNASYEKSTLSGITNVAGYALPPSAGNKGQCGYPGVNPALCFDYTPYYVNASGESAPFAPELQGTLAVDYAFEVGQGTLDPRVSFQYTGKQYASLFQIPYYTMGPRRIWNASLTYDVGQWDVEAFDTNFTNEVYYSGIMGSSVYYGDPEQYGLRVRRNF